MDFVDLDRSNILDLFHFDKDFLKKAFGILKHPICKIPCEF